MRLGWTPSDKTFLISALEAQSKHVPRAARISSTAKSSLHLTAADKFQFYLWTHFNAARCPTIMWLNSWHGPQPSFMLLQNGAEVANVKRTFLAHLLANPFDHGPRTGSSVHLNSVAAAGLDLHGFCCKNFHWVNGRTFRNGNFGDVKYELYEATNTTGFSRST